jgi:hypothetical protein
LVERMHNESDDAATRMPHHGEVRAMAPDLAPRWPAPASARETSTLIIYTYSVHLRWRRLPEAARICLTTLPAR